MRKRICAALFLLCAAGVLWLFGAETACWEEPELLWPEAVAVGPELDELVPYAGPLELEYTLPPWESGLRPALEILNLYTTAELRLDGVPFYQVPAGLGRVYLTLPEDFAGKTITLVMEKGADNPVPFFHLTDTTVLEEQVRADTSLRTFPAAAFGALFLLTLGLFLYGWAEGDRSWPVLLLSAAALGQAVHFYLENLPLDLLPPALYGLVLHQSLALLFAAPPLYLLLRMNKRRRVFAPFAVLPALIYWAAAGSCSASPPPPSSSAPCWSTGTAARRSVSFYPVWAAAPGSSRWRGPFRRRGRGCWRPPWGCSSGIRLYGSRWSCSTGALCCWRCAVWRAGWAISG